MHKYGYWTQDAQVLCPTCAEKLGNGIKLHMKYGMGRVQCTHCRAQIYVDTDLAQEYNLVYAARQAGFTEAFLSQTGGMCHLAIIPFEDNAFMPKKFICECGFHINPSDPGEYYWWIETYNDSYALKSERQASSIEEVLENISWMQRNCSAIPSSDRDDA